MKRLTAIGMGLIILMWGISGCTRVESVKEPDVIPLDQWMEGHALQKMVEQLKTNSFMKDLPFLIVRTKGEAFGKDIGHQIDALTEEIRERMIDYLLEFPDIRVIRKHPVSIPERPYTLHDLKCGRFIEPKMLITIDIRRLSDSLDRQVRMIIRAVDMERGEWIKGLSLSENVLLTSKQNENLTRFHPDQHLKGLKYLPFLPSQKDEMATFLAGNLSCMFSEAYGGDNFRVFVDGSKIQADEGDIVWFIQKQLQFCNEIQLTQNSDKADWVIMAESRKLVEGTGLSQLWMDVFRQENGDLIKGLATYAYYLSQNPKFFPVTGKWKIVDLPEGTIGGFMKITGNKDDGLRGDLFGPDGVSLINRGIFLEIHDRNLDWAYYDDRRHRTLKAKGLLLEDGRKMSVKVTPYPISGRPMLQVFIREEAQ